VSDTVGERLSFARPGSGDNENRPLVSHRRCLLLRIQIVQPRKFRWNTFVRIGHKNSIADSLARWQGISPSIAVMVNSQHAPSERGRSVLKSANHFYRCYARLAFKNVSYD
jgi:hypothetical protein